jgi:hypothetical protein
MPNTAPYGSWSSPITSDLIVAQITMLSDVRIDGDGVYWLEGRPQEQGRSAIVRAGGDGTAADITPPNFNVRTRVHEYGGGSWSLVGGTCIFSNFEDQRLYRQRTERTDPEPLTPEPVNPKHQLRYSDGVLDRARQRWIGVREDHTGEGEPVNTIVAIDLDQPGTSPGRVLVHAHDFFSSARLSPDASRMLWLAWDHPNMPWNGTTLYLAEIGPDGGPAGTRVIAGGVAESIFQPEWSPDGNEIVFVSDRTGWWNLYAWKIATGTTRPLCPMQAEFGAPQWNFAMSTFAFAGAQRIVCAYTKAGLGQLATLDLASGSLQAIETEFTEFGSVHASGNRVVFRGGASDRPTSIVALDLPSGECRVLKRATDLLDRTELGNLSKVEPVEFPTTGEKTAFGLFYPPRNPFDVPRGVSPQKLHHAPGHLVFERPTRFHWTSSTSASPRPRLSVPSVPPREDHERRPSPW